MTVDQIPLTLDVVFGEVFASMIMIMVMIMIDAADENFTHIGCCVRGSVCLKQEIHNLRVTLLGRLQHITL